MGRNPLEPIMHHHPALFKQMSEARNASLAPGALDKKTKLLVAMALDATKHAPNGVRVLAKLAMEAGATKEEIMEVLHVVYFIDGIGSMYTAAEGIEGLFEE
ncbi:carboxymuconolactone decarboxylase family protein [Anaerotalea alkaliphila]|uniref:Carboxymuconolactone decarboxylase family protein n=1 Tax=Anaerotalea alkaliphila TaxID=2662126 RepID=A0A7X5KL51_9FIRM|nr:carboxymuconolactone decarboxylase family protein [Anaerotalea alkaliphila]NDL66334.1 carboxymuconolactone decarboxylase family protein [Anaerotalea alkaliphila]